MSSGPISDEVRNAALDRLRAGEQVTDVARDIGVNKSTVSKWATKAGVAVVTEGRTANATRAAQTKWAERRATLIDDMGQVAAELLQKARTADDARQAQGFATSVAIFVDKAQLLSGAATSRHEVRDVERRRERILQMADELEERRQAKAG